LVVDHLEEQGRHRFAFVASDPSTSTVADRIAAYRSRFADHPEALERIYVGELSLRWGSEAASRILAEGAALPDALICANDLIALGAMQRLRAAGIRIPEDVAVTGVDDTPFARIAEPTLTTVRQPIEQMAEEAVAMLVARRSHPSRAPRRLIMTPELMIRGSTVVGATADATARS
jgi:LacI family transcriptional regulator, galactose operon repressor